MNEIKDIKDPAMIYLEQTTMKNINDSCDGESSKSIDKVNTKKRDFKLECMNKPYENKKDDELNESLLPNGNLWIA